MDEYALTAQVVTETRYVKAVVSMRLPLDEPPAGLEFVFAPDYSVGGKFYVDGQFQTDPPT